MFNSKIEWCHDTINLWWGCVQVHLGCLYCYAMIWAERFKYFIWGIKSPRREIGSWEVMLMKSQNRAEKEGTIRRVFIGSMMDIFEKPMPLVKGKGKDEKILPYNTGDLRNKLFNEYVPKCPNVEFLFLTKRPSNINRFIPESWKTNPPKNVIFGTSPVNQETANTLIPQLLLVNGRKFLSVEPQLDKIDLTPWLGKLSWVICGGESGRKKRPFNPDWARIIRDDCRRASVPFFMKQWDKVRDVPEDLLIHQFPGSEILPAEPKIESAPISKNKLTVLESLLEWPSNVLHPLFK